MGNCDMYILFTGNTYSSSYHKSLMCQSQSLGFWFKETLLYYRYTTEHYNIIPRPSQRVLKEHCSALKMSVTNSPYSRLPEYKVHWHHTVLLLQWSHWFFDGGTQSKMKKKNNYTNINEPMS